MGTSSPKAPKSQANGSDQSASYYNSVAGAARLFLSGIPKDSRAHHTSSEHLASILQLWKMSPSTVRDQPQVLCLSILRCNFKHMDVERY